MTPLIERLRASIPALLPMTYEHGPDYGMLFGPSFQAMTMNPQALQDALEALPSLLAEIERRDGLLRECLEKGRQHHPRCETVKTGLGEKCNCGLHELRTRIQAVLAGEK